MGTKGSLVANGSRYHDSNGITCQLNYSAYYQFNDYYYYGVRTTIYHGYQIGSYPSTTPVQLATATGYTTSPNQTTASCSYTTTWDRDHDTWYVSWKATSTSETVSGYSGVGESETVTGQFTVLPREHYYIKFSTNGANPTESIGNWPSDTLYWFNEPYTFPSTAPTRAGYTFKYWALDSAGTYRPGNVFFPGDTWNTYGTSPYINEATIYFYAIWEENSPTPTTYTGWTNLSGTSTTAYRTASPPSTYRPASSSSGTYIYVDFNVSITSTDTTARTFSARIQYSTNKTTWYNDSRGSETWYPSGQSGTFAYSGCYFGEAGTQTYSSSSVFYIRVAVTYPKMNTSTGVATNTTVYTPVVTVNAASDNSEITNLEGVNLVVTRTSSYSSTSYYATGNYMYPVFSYKYSGTGSNAQTINAYLQYRQAGTSTWYTASGFSYSSSRTPTGSSTSYTTVSNASFTRSSGTTFSYSYGWEFRVKLTAYRSVAGTTITTYTPIYSVNAYATFVLLDFAANEYGVAFGQVSNSTSSSRRFEISSNLIFYNYATSYHSGSNTFSGSTTFSGGVTISSTSLGVSSYAVFSGGVRIETASLSVASSATFNGGLTSTSTTSISGSATFSGGVTIKTSSLTVSSTSTFSDTVTISGIINASNHAYFAHDVHLNSDSSHTVNGYTYVAPGRAYAGTYSSSWVGKLYCACEIYNAFSTSLPSSGTLNLSSSSSLYEYIDVYYCVVNVGGSSLTGAFGTGAPRQFARCSPASSSSTSCSGVVLALPGNALTSISARTSTTHQQVTAALRFYTSTATLGTFSTYENFSHTAAYNSSITPQGGIDYTSTTTAEQTPTYTNIRILRIVGWRHA